MPDYLKLAREARDAWTCKLRTVVLPMIPALCDAIEAQAAHIARLDEELGFARNKRDGAHAHAEALEKKIESQSAEIERQRKLIESAAASVRAGHHDTVVEQRAEIERLRVEIVKLKHGCDHATYSESPIGVKQCSACGKTSYRGDQWKGGWT